MASSKNFRLNEEDLAMLHWLKENYKGGENKEVDVIRFGLANLYADSMRENYKNSVEKSLMTFDEFLVTSLYKEKKKLNVSV